MLAATMTRAGLPTYYYYSATAPPILLMTDENKATCTVFHRDLEAFGAFVISD